MVERIVSIGECMVELAPRADGCYVLGFAGDTLNTAWYLRGRLPPDYRIDYVTCVGDDPFSQDMVAFFEQAGLGTAHVARLAGATVGLYMIRLSGGERSFAYWRSTSAARSLARDPSRLEAALAGARIAYVSGITLAILPDADRPTLLEALARARSLGTIVVFDPNLRPRLFPSIAAMRETVTAAARHADVVLPSFEDEQTHFGDASPEATAHRYAALGAPLVVVKNGPGEIVAAEKDRLSRHAAVKAASVVDTTAAGDSFNAGFLAARLGGAPVADAVQAGARLAARVIGARGALVATD
jgi:2-dehydro-3-deoxygluconokinase